MNIQGNLRSYTQSLPPVVQHYVAVNLDTVPKATNHILVFLAISDFFLLINSMRVTFTTFLGASMLTFLTCFVTMVTNNSRISFAPRGLEPTEFMIGLCLGLCVAGAILSFFLSMTFGRLYSFCKNGAKGDWCVAARGPLWSIWWWSSMACCSNMLLSYCVAKGREEISQTQQQQYSSIDSEGISDVSSLTNTAAGIETTSPFQQGSQMQTPQHIQPMPQQSAQQEFGGYPYPQTGPNIAPI
eukprot:jgi/Psemu1/287914/fgenesh1_pg.220_\